MQILSLTKHRNFNPLKIQPHYKDQIVISTSSGYEVIQKSKIIYAEADSNYCRIFCYGRSPVLCSKTLKFIAEKIGPSFIRIHRKHLINPVFLTKVRHGSPMQVVLETGDLLTVSRSSIAGLMRYLEERS